MEAIKSTHQGQLPFPTLSQEATKTNILPRLHSASLVSLGQLCDDKCDITLNKREIKVFKNNLQLLTGPRNPFDGLWDIHIPRYIPYKHPLNKLNVIIQKSTTKKDLVQFYHAAAYSPAIPTFLRAVQNGNFQSWPGLTPDLIRKHLTPMIATHFGHLNQERQNLQSTQQKPQRYKTVKKTNSKYVDATNQQEGQEFQLGHSMCQEDL